MAASHHPARTVDARLCTCHGAPVDDGPTPEQAPRPGVDDTLLRCALQLGATTDALRRLTEILRGERPLDRTVPVGPRDGTPQPAPVAERSVAATGPAVELVVPAVEAPALPAAVVIPPVVPVLDALPAVA